MRLTDGATENEGRIEVRQNVEDSWGIVCDNWFDINDANVFCKMLGYTNGAETAYTNSHFGHGNLDFHMDDLVCTGQELTFLDCPYGGWGSHNCGSTEATGVRCDPGWSGSSKYIILFEIVNLLKVFCEFKILLFQFWK